DPRRALDEALRPFERPPRPGGELPGELPGRRVRILDERPEADALRFLGTHLARGVEQFERLRLSHQPRQVVAETAVRTNAAACEGGEEPRPWPQEADVER